ncbi:hypothetical protein DES51_1371 [Dielma fastidiosa]|uniref:Cell wall binding repeat protein n=4 Tax=Dielma fastidiosa TaxID=1034346 RepID=A0A318KDC3_9FIRM|nr:hypothetical protein [Dielma fastidiosa]PXX73415.1 hypothetical protein DES51_1371 [Dielma fastidiosa]
MNKYSSKAIKTAATVGMSLAMVLSAAAPVMADSSTAIKGGICDGLMDDKPADCGALVYLEVLSQLDGAKFNTVTLDNDMKALNKADKKVNILEVIADYAVELLEFADPETGEAGYTERANIYTWLKVVDGIEDYAGEGSIKAKDVKDTSTLAKVMKNTNNETGKEHDWSVINDENYLDAKAALKELKDFKADYGKYLGIDSDGEYSNDLAGAVQDTYVSLNNNINEYLGVTADKDLSFFVLAFDTILQNDLDGKTTDIQTQVEKGNKDSTIAKILQGEKEDVVEALDPAKIELNNKTQIKKRIDLIKNHSYYDRFKDEDSVIAILDAYQELLDNIGTNADVLKSDEYNAFIKTKVANVKADNKVTLKEFLKNIDEDKNLKTDKEKAEKLASLLNSEQWVILKDAKEEVMDSIYTMETRKVGNYYVNKSDYTTNSTSAQRSTFNNTFPGYLYALVDKEEGLFGYDLVEKQMNEVAEALEAVTTAIAKITPANIKATDKKTLEAAEDAIYELTKGGDYEDNLTKTEAKTVRAAETKIENLREAFDNLGTTAVAGWYDMGNGNWGYNNEDGTPAAYKWVASGSDWYMIKDGKMLRNTWLATDGGRWYYLDNAGKMVTNQSVDGCWINSYGVYMSPTYNG